MWIRLASFVLALAHAFECPLPNLSVGSIHLNQNNYMQFKKENRLFVLGMSDKNCEECCLAEELLNDVFKDFKAKKFSFQTKKKKALEIPVARVDVSKKYSFVS